jgi:hypothetical protein
MMMMTAGSVISRMEQLRVSAKKVHFFPIWLDVCYTSAGN